MPAVNMVSIFQINSNFVCGHVHTKRRSYSWEKMRQDKDAHSACGVSNLQIIAPDSRCIYAVHQGSWLDRREPHAALDRSEHLAF